MSERQSLIPIIHTLLQDGTFRTVEQIAVEIQPQVDRELRHADIRYALRIMAISLIHHISNPSDENQDTYGILQAQMAGRTAEAPEMDRELRPVEKEIMAFLRSNNLPQSIDNVFAQFPNLDQLEIRTALNRMCRILRIGLVVDFSTGNSYYYAK